jgi:hypothetical protein
MAQETLDSLIQVMFTLSLPEQVKVIERMQDHVYLQTCDFDPLTKERLKARAEEGIAQIKRGECLAHEEVMQRVNQRIERNYVAAI